MAHHLTSIHTKWAYLVWVETHLMYLAYFMYLVWEKSSVSTFMSHLLLGCLRSRSNIPPSVNSFSVLSVKLSYAYCVGKFSKFLANNGLWTNEVALGATKKLKVLILIGKGCTPFLPQHLRKVTYRSRSLLKFTFLSAKRA